MIVSNLNEEHIKEKEKVENSFERVFNLRSDKEKESKLD